MRLHQATKLIDQQTEDRDKPKHIYEYRKVTEEILDNAPVTAYEELSSDAFDQDGKPLFEISQCQFKGGLFESRVKFIKAVHLIYPSHAQLVQAKALHHTCHYSIVQEQMEQFEEHTSCLKVSVIHYERSQSHCGDKNDFIKVWNYRSESFSKIEALFNELRFDHTAHAVSDTYQEEKRGNSQASFGVSTQNLKVRNNLGKAVPQFNKGTADHVDSMLVLSKLLETINGLTSNQSGPPTESPLPTAAAPFPTNGFYHQFIQQEHSAFAKAIHPECKFEGLTNGKYDQWARLYAHVDKHNSHLEHRN